MALLLVFVGVSGRALPALAEEAIASDESEEPGVVVEGTRGHPTTRPTEPGVASWTATRERLDPAGMTLGDTLREAPGVQVSQIGGLGATTTARLRGATSAQTPVYFGDIRLNDEVGGVADLGLVPNFLVERIEVYRSHAPRTMAQLGMGGAIILVPRTSGPSRGLIRTEIGSYGTRSVSALGSLSEEKRHLSFGASLDGADNDYSFENSRGTLFVSNDDRPAKLENADTTGKSFWASETERFGKAEVTFVMSHFGREQGAPKLALVQTELARVSYEKTLVAVSSRIPLGSSEFKLGSTALLGETVVSDPSRELSLLAARTRSPGERIEHGLGYTNHLTKHFDLLGQVNVSLERQKRYELRTAEEVLALGARRSTLRAAMGAEYRPIEALSFSGLVEGRCITTTTTASGGVCDDPLPTGRGGILGKFGAVEVYVNGANYARLPTLSELYGTSIVIRGNDHLGPENGTTLEGGFRYQITRNGEIPLAWFDASAFSRFSTDLIIYSRTPQGYLTPVNRAGARTMGAEFLVGASPITGLFLEGQLSLLDPRDTSSNRRSVSDLLPFLSRLTGSAVARYKWSLPEATRSTLGLGARFLYQSNRYADAAGLAVIPEQTSFDLELDYGAFDDLFALHSRVSNVLDASRFDIVGFPLPGRSFYLAMEIKWQ